MHDFIPAADDDLELRVRIYCESNDRTLLDIAIIVLIGTFPEPWHTIGTFSNHLFDDDFGITIAGRWIACDLPDRDLHPPSEWDERLDVLAREGMCEKLSYGEVVRCGRIDLAYFQELHPVDPGEEFAVLSARGFEEYIHIREQVLMVPPLEDSDFGG